MGDIHDRIKHYETFDEPRDAYSFRDFVEQYRKWYGKHPAGYDCWVYWIDDDGVEHAVILGDDTKHCKWVWVHSGSCD